MTKAISFGSEEEKRQFASVFPEVVTNLINACTDVPELRAYYTELLYENAGMDKQSTGFLVNAIYKIFETPENITPENIKLANILGWCCNMLFAMEILLDDVVESTDHRYGKLCWYRRRDVGLDAINDGILLENGIYFILKQHFSELPSYVPLVECFHDAAVQTVVGQRLDGFFAGPGNPRLDLFTMDKYRTLIKCKITYPLYILPGTVGLYFAGKSDPKLQAQVNAILTELGFFFGAQNDMLDCYGNPEVTGKESNDITRGNCTWLAVKALQQGTLAQKDVLKKHYGKPGRENMLKVRNLYSELGLLYQFLEYEKESFDIVHQAVQQLQNDEQRQHFHKIADAVYRQRK